MPPFVLLAAALLAPAPDPAPAPPSALAVVPTPGDWPAFLGPRGTGVSDQTGLRDAVPDAAALLAWRAEIGEGYSAPVVVTVAAPKNATAGEPTYAVLTHRREGAREVLTRRDLATGAVVWETAAPTAYRDPYGYNGGPRASPLAVLDGVLPQQAGGGAVYTLGAAGRAACVDLTTGEERWSRDFNADLDIPRWFFGVGGSPVLYDRPHETPLVIFAPGGQPNAGVVAVDAATGATVWQAVGKATWDGAESPDGPYQWTGEEQVVSYSTPTLATLRGEPHLLCLVRQGLVSLDPRTGAERFHYWFRSRKYESVNAVRPVVVGNRILLSAAYELGSVLLEVNASGDGVTEVWRKPDLLTCHWSTPVVHDGFIYGFAGRHEREGELQCVDLATGELKWSEDGRDAAGAITPSRTAAGYTNAAGERVPFPYFGRGSCVLAPQVGGEPGGEGGTLYILGERGTLHCAAPSAEGYQERSRTAVPGVGYPAWPAPVLSHGRLLLADDETLTVLDLRQ